MGLGHGPRTMGIGPRCASGACPGKVHTGLPFAAGLAFAQQHEANVEFQFRSLRPTQVFAASRALSLLFLKVAPVGRGSIPVRFMQPDAI